MEKERIDLSVSSDLGGVLGSGDPVKAFDGAQDRVDRLDMLATHCEDRCRGARAELEELGELALQEAVMLPVIRLHDRIREGEGAMVQANNALAYAELHLGELMDEDLEQHSVSMKRRWQAGSRIVVVCKAGTP